MYPWPCMLIVGYVIVGNSDAILYFEVNDLYYKELCWFYK